MGEEKNTTEHDYKKYFDEAQYNTFVIGKDGKVNTKKESIVEAIVALISNDDRKLKDEALLLIKKENSVELITQTIKALKGKKQKALLIAACWESDLNIKGHQAFFADLAVDTDPLVSIEAITVLESTSSQWNDDELKKTISLIEKAIAQKHTNTVLLEDLLHLLKEI